MNDPLLSKSSPSQSSCCVVFPFDQAVCKFKRDIYIPVHTVGTQENITSEEVNKVLDLVELGTYKLPTTKKKVLSICHRLLLPVIAMIILNNLWYDTSRFVWKKWSPFAGYCIIATVYFIISQRYQIKVAREDVKTIIQTQQASFLKKGFRWVMPSNFPNWIELHKDNGEQEASERYQVIPLPSVDRVKQIGTKIIEMVNSKE